MNGLIGLGQFNGPADADAPWAGSTTVGPGETAQVGQLNVEGYEHDYQLGIRVEAAPVRLVVESQFMGGRVVIDHTTVLGDGGGWSLPPAGSWVLTATNLSPANASTVSWFLVRDGSADLHAPYDFVVTGLAEGGGGGPGTWTDLSDIGTSTQGWAPPDRHQLCVVPSGNLDFRFRDEANTTTFGFWNTSSPVNLKHPGRGRLQVRHPGASATLRNALAVWNRA
jgi:hypothetical protein